MGSTAPIGSANYHVINPRPTLWSETLPLVRSRKHSEDISVLTLPSWLDSLRQSASATDDNSKSSAIKLLAFFHNLQAQTQVAKEPVILDMKETVLSSPTLADLEPVLEEWIDY